ncbi:hypothetical protein FOMA001_g9038 [Fusarium oxysporum f. sp. matthiolae]|nr:hypothetical protein FOMA001_g9038 [Fusarium oxysporum f. sp. matthiolae]
MLNEFAGIDFPCASYVPLGDGYDQVLPSGRACATQGAVLGQDFVSGSTYLSIAYGYENSHRWRNCGVMIAFAVLYLGLHLAAADTDGKTSCVQDSISNTANYSYSGSSGAGKITLLDVLASRVTMGVVSGDMLVNGIPRDDSFQRKTGYVQQQDLHVPTSTVREALTFSALLRQSSQYTRQEKIDYVDTVISLLSMEDYADAIIGVPGEGLNVEQRKRLTIGVELAARP